MIIAAATPPPPELPVSDPVDSPPVSVNVGGVDNQINGVGGVDLIGDATSWPSLSESTRPSMRSMSPVVVVPPDHHHHSPPVVVVASQAPAISPSPQNPRPHSGNGNPNNRQRSSSRGGSSRGGTSRGTFIRHPPPPQQLPSPPPLPPAFYGGFEGQFRGPFYYGNGFAPHPRPTDHQRGDHFNNVIRGPPHQGFHHRDVRFPMSFPIPPQQLVPYPLMPPPVFPPEHFMGMPPYTGGHAPVPPPSLSPPPQVDETRTKLLNQINYYFSDDNLVKDMYLRSQMDAAGWVSLGLIAGFKKVKGLTQDRQFILETLDASSVVEVQGDKIRRRNDWTRWVLPGSRSGSQEPTAELSSIIMFMQNATLEEAHAADRSSSSSTNNASSSRRELLT